MKKKPAVDMSKTYTDLQGFTGATGLEPATYGVTGRRSNQLNYAPGRATSLAGYRRSAINAAACLAPSVSTGR